MPEPDLFPPQERPAKHSETSSSHYLSDALSPSPVPMNVGAQHPLPVQFPAVVFEQDILQIKEPFPLWWGKIMDPLQSANRWLTRMQNPQYKAPPAQTTLMLPSKLLWITSSSHSSNTTTELQAMNNNQRYNSEISSRTPVSEEQISHHTKGNCRILEQAAY